MSIKDLTDGWYIYTDQIPHLLLALLVLFFGWLVAKGIGKSVELALRKTDLDNKLFSNFGNRKYSIEFIIGRIVYYTLLIVVWIIFFNMLQLSLIAEPLVQMVSIMTAAIPNLLKAALILLFAWVVAMILRLLFKKSAASFHLESRLVQWRMAKSELDADNKVDSVAKVIFYFVLLLFLPGVLGALQMEGISEPFAHALSAILALIPKFFAAALIVFIGWLIAKIVRDILTNFLKSTGTDKLGQRFGLIKNVEETSLSGIIGNIVFILILILTIITALERLELKGIADPAIAMLQDVLTLIPNIVVAAILLLVGVWLGKWVERLVAQMLRNFRLDHVLDMMGIGSLTPEQPKYTLSQIVGLLAKVVVILIFTVEALQIVHLDSLVTLGSGIIAYLPRLFAALFIVGIGLYLGHFIQQVLQNIVKHSYSRTLAAIAKYTIFALTVFMALDQLGVAHSIVNAAFILILGGFALAFAFAFGLGGKDFAAKYLRKLDSKLDEENNHL